MLVSHNHDINMIVTSENLTEYNSGFDTDSIKPFELFDISTELTSCGNSWGGDPGVHLISLNCIHISFLCIYSLPLTQGQMPQQI